MKRLTLKLLLFIVVWYAIVTEFGLNPDIAFLLTLGLYGGFGLALRLAGQAASLIGPFTFGLLLQGILCIALLWWLAPAVFHAVPLVFDLLAVVLIAMMGAQARFAHEERRLQGKRFDPSEHSGLVLAVVFGGLAVCMFALRQWGSLWPVIGWALIPGLPFLFGWRMAPMAAADRTDARVGDADMFRDAGLSDER